ncbi:ubiquitin carboxyl-terminal hydrolase 37 [Plakobranchus ocellatus]|uniref:Ubiquitin carboxyl-terminal hydrolase 37 n=1 Tax=Plakobranchus ocellatus TaxID=259542 RepID=A0AAV4D348_9GAST|nr:ubiquitin carboxyl-terminal hydrolase 37 [Plakobranchus ocellatus]
MQKPPHATFRGQVKRGQDNWKKGRVQFYVEVESGFWTVQLYHEVNPDRVVHRYKSLLGKSANIVFKCNRLIIGDKRDGELHIKIPDYEASNAQKLVKKIMSYNVSTPTHNRAEVGLNTSLNRLSGSKEKLNVTPTGLSTLPRNDGWLSKKTPPPMQQDRHHHSSAKRKIQLDHASSPRTNGSVGSSAGQSILCNGDSFTIDEDEEDEEVTFPGFTGQRSSNNVNIAKGFGTTNFYGAQNSLMTENAYRNLNLKPTSSGAKSHLASPSQQNGLRSPKVKRPKLSDLEDADRENKVVVKSSSKALIKGALANRMTAKVPSLSDPQGEEACAGVANESAVSQDTSGHLGDGHTVGFDNLGNTCFMNSPLQCLSSLEPLSLDIQSAVCQFGRQLPPNSITKMLYLLMKDVRKLDVRAERVREILTRLRHDINGKFEYNTQQDAHELLAELLDRTDEEVKALLNKIGGKAESSSKLLPSTSHLNSPPSDSGTCTRKDDEAAAASQAGKPVSEEIVRSTPTEANFTWFYKTSFFFHECKTEVVSSQDERDTTLMLALDSKTINLQDCIDKYFESSEVDMRCEKCGKEEKATMTRKIVKRPRCFILNLLRYHTHNLEAKKKLDRVTIPRFMSVVEFCAEDVKAAPAIEPVFMLDREKILADVDSKISDSESQITSNSLGQLDTFGEEMDPPYLPPDLPPRKPPAELMSSEIPELQDDGFSFYGSVGEKSIRGGSEQRFRRMFDPPGSSRDTESEIKPPASALTPPSDDDDVTDFNQVVPSTTIQGCGPNCSSPKPDRERRAGISIPVTPIIHDSALSTDDNPLKTEPVARSRPIDQVCSPLTVDVTLPRPLRRRNPAGDISKCTTVAHKQLSSSEVLVSQIPGISLDNTFLPHCFQEVEVPYETSPGLPVGSANEEIGPDLAVEAARCGRQVAMAMSVSEEMRKQEAEEHDSKATEDTGSDKDVALNFASNRARPDGSSEKRNSVNEQEQRNDWEDIDRATVKRLANHLADQFAEVEQHIEMARQAEEDFTEIYSGAQSIILNTSEMVRTLLTRQLEDGESTDSDNFKTNEQLTLCLALMQRSLTGERSLDDEFDFYKVIRKLIALRYRSVSGHAAQMNHLVNDLAMYLAAKDVGVVVDPDSPKPANLPVPTVETNANTMAKENKVSDCCPESEQARTKEEDGFGGEGQDGCTLHEDVFMEEDSGNRGSLEVNTSRTVHNGSSSLGEGESESWSTEGMSGKQTSLYIQSIRGRRKSSGEDDSDKVQKRRKDNEPEEESSGALADVSHSATINTTKNNNSLCDAGFLSDSVDKSSFTEDPLLLERPISTWSEQDLQKVDIDGLNEEDMMVYAQALSRFEYEREQINYTVSTSARTAYQDPYFLEDIIDSCDDSTAISYDEISANGRDSSGQRENKDGPKNTDKLDDSSKIPGEVSSTSGSSLSETSDVEREAENISKIKDSDGASNSKTKNGVESSEKIPELLCEETLSDSDEPDGMADDQNAKKVKGLKGGQSAYSSSSSCSCSRRLNGEGASVEESLHASDGKPCQSCKGQAPQCSETSAKVLSPCKGLRNHSNTLPPLDKSSSSSSSGSVERNVRSRQSSTRSPRHRPLSPGASPLSSPTSSVTGHQKSSLARDIQMRSPSASQSSPRKETYSLSQTKSAKNDLARLRSPSTASPRKRPCKDSSAFGAKSAVVSVSKCLSFEDENASSLKGSQNSVKQLLASEDGTKSLSSNSILDNYPMQEDLINGSLAKSENGEEADPDGINGILSLSNTNRCDNSSPLFPSLLKSNSKEGEDQTTSLTSSYTGSIPIPVPVSGSLHNSTNNMKLDVSSNAAASPKEEVNAVKAATAKVFREAVADLSSLDAKENLWKRDESEEASDTRVVSARSQLSPNEEKENLIDSLARKERLENIEMGKADSSYRLVGIVNHHGESLFAGHYTAFSFNFNKQRWFFMDDKHTRQTVEATARAESANSGYVFFYMDKDIFDKYALNVSERPPKGGSTNS